VVSSHGYRHRDLLRPDDAANRLQQLAVSFQ
jgi:hypothetical protein